MPINQFYFTVLLVAFLQTGSAFNNQLLAKQYSNIIPAPQNVNVNEGSFTSDERTRIIYSQSSLKQIAEEFQNNLKTDVGFDIDVRKCRISKKLKSNIELQLQKGFENEAYQIVINMEKISCKASTQAGLFYAIQSLRQLIQINEGRFVIPCMVIEDAPRFEWRGFMLDEARQFFGKKTVMQYLDIMARLKMNRFHWHLSDEQAFRLGIEKFPLLASVGAKGSWSDRNAPAAFYSQQEIKEIVAYAAQRHIQIIPEIDMPGHATAITRSYPYLSGGGKGRWAGFTLNPARESTYQFIDSLMTEIATLFPAPYIHIGADEVHFGNQSWHTDTTIQNFIQTNRLNNEVGLEHYFVRRVNEIVKRKGKQIIGWDEIINTGVNNQDAYVMWWRHDKPELLSQAFTKGFKVILTPRLPCYLDYVQDESHQIGRRKFWDTPMFNTLKIVYDFPDSPHKSAGIIHENKKQVLGLQASFWSERTADQKRLDFLTFPRLIAMAEAGWTNLEAKSYQRFVERLKYFLPILDREGIYYFNVFDSSLTPEPWGPTKEDLIPEENAKHME
jgi:hexosaminidase